MLFLKILTCFLLTRPFERRKRKKRKKCTAPHILQVLKGALGSKENPKING